MFKSSLLAAVAVANEPHLYGASRNDKYDVVVTQVSGQENFIALD